MVRENHDRRGWRLSPLASRFGQRLMNQQSWCWGRDVCCPRGNVLMRYGFERHRDKRGRERATCYRLDQNSRHVALWGFGMFYGERSLGGLFLDRFDFRPTWAPIESLALDIHWPDELPAFARPRATGQWKRARRLWQRALRWIASYENWVSRECGLKYRQQCVDAWLHPFVPATKIVSAWRFLSERPWEEGDSSWRDGFLRYEISTER